MLLIWREVSVRGLMLSKLSLYPLGFLLLVMFTKEGGKTTSNPTVFNPQLTFTTTMLRHLKHLL
jgi:hypothetical protein